MAEHNLLTVGRLAEGALVAKRAVMHGTGSGQVKAVTGANVAVFGVAKGQEGETIATGSMVDVMVDGIAEVQAGGVVTAGDWVKVDADGKAVACASVAGHVHATDGNAGDTDPSNPELAFGLSLTAAGAEDDIIEVRLVPCVIG